MPSDTEVFGFQGLPALIESEATNLAGKSDEDVGREHLSHSAISDLTACSQKYGFSRDLGIVTKVKAAPLTMGKAFQLAVEESDPQVGYDDLLAGGVIMSQEDSDKLHIQATIVKCAAALYLELYSPEPDSEKELEYRVQLRNPWTGAYSRTFDLLGYADELADRDGRLVLIENKLVGQIGAPQIRKLPLDRQLALSAYGIWRATGREILEVEYRWTRKPSIKQKKGETVAEFCQRLEQDYFARPEFYAHQEKIIRSTADLVRIEAELWTWAEQIRAGRREKVWPRNTGHCAEYGGCPYMPICLGEPDAAALYEPKTDDRNNNNGGTK